MNKQIKFRAWDGEQLLQNVGIHPHLMMVLTDDDYLYNEGDEGSVILSVMNTAYKIMQFTGLSDKNGKEIYEGDIIEQDINGNKIRGIINFYDNGFWIKNPDNTLHLPNDRLIIGNIYENPELL